ncbi:unnamed protein product [Urochloa decumbens]|uniref:COX assembly mitochondrial protein n=2 Tax=Urochloa decumbens TaxID=240449 RepID=A0ABC8ZY14_9POAL
MIKFHGLTCINECMEIMYFVLVFQLYVSMYDVTLGQCILNSMPLCSLTFPYLSLEMHPPLTLHRHPMCAEIIEEFQKCHLDHPVKKFFGECTDLKIKLDRCFRQEKALKRKANFEESKKFKEQLQAYKREIAEKNKE